MKRLLWPAVLLAACGPSAPSIRTHDLGSGRWELQCSAPLSRCSEQAAELCKDRGYDVVSGHDQRKLYGHESGESRVALRSSRLLVVCRGPDNEARLPSTAEVVPTPTEAAHVQPKPERASACTPGTTQKCYGAAACEGGQSCLANGSGYGPCDCGKVAAPPPAATNAP